MGVLGFRSLRVWGFGVYFLGFRVSVRVSDVGHFCIGFWDKGVRALVFRISKFFVLRIKALRFRLLGFRI